MCCVIRILVLSLFAWQTARAEGTSTRERDELTRVILNCMYFWKIPPEAQKGSTHFWGYKDMERVKADTVKTVWVSIESKDTGARANYLFDLDTQKLSGTSLTYWDFVKQQAIATTMPTGNVRYFVVYICFTQGVSGGSAVIETGNACIGNWGKVEYRSTPLPTVSHVERGPVKCCF
jgi:hypothetical protein